MSRAVVLVLDGLGIGAMVDAEPRDRSANTLEHVLAETGVRLPNLTALGLTSGGGQRDPVPTPKAAWGSVRLAHPGADTYLGHQELMGAPVDRVSPSLLEDRREEVTAALRDAGLVVGELSGGLPPILVDDRVLIADNLEAVAGLSINVTASLDEITFEELLRIGKVVRDAVPTPRVIVVGGRGFSFHQVLEHVRPGEQGQLGVDTPALGVYDENFRVRHLGADLNQHGQLAERTARGGQEVVLLGKAADVIACSRAARDPAIDTAVVLDRVGAALQSLGQGLVVANVQETDLAGHEQNPGRYAQVLETVDGRLPDLLAALRPDDVLAITGDHGNDPTIGHSQHTRERTPLLLVGDSIAPAFLGERPTLADVGATLADVLGVGALATGVSLLREVSCSSTP